MRKYYDVAFTDYSHTLIFASEGISYSLVAEYFGKKIVGLVEIADWRVWAYGYAYTEI